MKLNRPELIDTIVSGSRESSTLAVFFHAAVAERAGLGATDEKALSILNQLGPLTAGDVARYTGLTTASVTSLIDRLEKAGFVQRRRDPRDRRRVIVQPDRSRLVDFERFFGSFAEGFRGLLAKYSDVQLSVIADFLTLAVQHSRETMAKLDQVAPRQQKHPAVAPSPRAT